MTIIAEIHITSMLNRSAESDLTNVNYFLSRPRSVPAADLQSRKPETPKKVVPVSVIDKLSSIIGAEIRQCELLTLRKTIFADILGRPSRSECRLKTANAAAFEAHASEIMATLENRTVMVSVMRVALKSRSKVAEKQTLLMHAFKIV
jgi:hypothetical protein